MRFAKNIKIKTRKFFILCNFNLKSEKNEYNNYQYRKWKSKNWKAVMELLVYTAIYSIWFEKKCQMHVWRGMCPFLLLLNNVGENHSLDIIQRHQTNRQYQYEPRRCHYSIPKWCYKWHNRHQSCTGGVFSGGTWCSSDMS